MKNQYFGDSRDFYKYDLLLKLMGCGLGFEQLVMGWWLTPDDQSTDGEIRDYELGSRDKKLHDWLQAQHHRPHRDVRRLAEYPAVAQAPWTYSPVLDVVPDDPAARAAYVDQVVALSSLPSLVFLDPDNGMMTRSASPGLRCKYVDYPEVARIVESIHEESALLVFQYLPRMKREKFYPAALGRLRAEAGVRHVTWLSPDNVVAYFLITKARKRLGDVTAALKPYLASNAFRGPSRGEA